MKTTFITVLGACTRRKHFIHFKQSREKKQYPCACIFLVTKKKPLELPFLKAFYSHYWEKLFWRNYIISIMNSTRYKYWCMGRQKKKEGQKTHNDSWNYFGNRTLLTLLWLGTFSKAWFMVMLDLLHAV